MIYGKLTDRQARFLQEYLVDLNATRAAIRAGYSRRSASQRGWELRRHPEIARRVDAVLADRAAVADITPERVLRELAMMAFANLGDCLADAGGGAGDMAGLSRAQKAAIVEMQVEEGGSATGGASGVAAGGTASGGTASGGAASGGRRAKYKLGGKARSLELIGRALGLFAAQPRRKPGEGAAAEGALPGGNFLDEEALLHRPLSDMELHQQFLALLVRENRREAEEAARAGGGGEPRIDPLPNPSPARGRGAL